MACASFFFSFPFFSFVFSRTPSKKKQDKVACFSSPSVSKLDEKNINIQPTFKPSARDIYCLPALFVVSFFLTMPVVVVVVVFVCSLTSLPLPVPCQKEKNTKKIEPARFEHGSSRLNSLFFSDPTRTCFCKRTIKNCLSFIPTSGE